MKTNSCLALQAPSNSRMLHSRNGEIMNTLVFMLVAILLPTWILGTLYLTYFPASATDSGSSDSQLASNNDAATDPSALGDGTQSENDSQNDTDQTAQGIGGGGGSKDSNSTGGDFDPGRANGASGLAADQAASYDEKIKSLQEQLDAKSQAFDQLRQTSMNRSDSTADTSQLKNQIADLTQERDQLKTKLASAMDTSNDMNSTNFQNQITALTQERDQLKMKLTSDDQPSEKMAQLDQQIRTLEANSESQTTEIQTLQDRLVKAEEAKQDAENELAAAKTDMAANLADTSPTLAGSTSSNQPLEFREWVSSRGSKARLAFVRWEDDRVIVVNEEGKEFRLSLNRLSPADQNYVDGKR